WIKEISINRGTTSSGVISISIDHDSLLYLWNEISPLIALNLLIGILLLASINASFIKFSQYMDQFSQDDHAAILWIFLILFTFSRPPQHLLHQAVFVGAGTTGIGGGRKSTF